MGTALLYIRWRQFNREVKGLGIYLVVFIAITIVLCFISYHQFKNSTNGWYIVALLSLTCLVIHANRKDKNFIYKQLDGPHYQMFLEYLFLTLPFSITSLVTKSWLCFPVLVAILSAIPFLKFQYKQRAVFKNLSAIIPATNYEWISGFRKQYIAFICLYTLAVAFCWVRILPLALLWFITIMVSSFHLENEPVHILRAANKSARQFLISKIKTNISYVLILFSLPVIVNAIVVREFLTITLLFIPAQIALLCFAICLKYCTYKPNTNQLGNNVAFSIIAILSAMPYFLPIPLLLSVFYFYKAEKNLKLYLHD